MLPSFPPSDIIQTILDLHGDIVGLLAALDTSQAIARLKADPHFILVLAGDYVDRGLSQLLLLPLITELKRMFPKQVVLLRGNHEVGVCGVWLLLWSAGYGCCYATAALLCVTKPPSVSGHATYPCCIVCVPSVQVAATSCSCSWSTNTLW